MKMCRTPAREAALWLFVAVSLAGSVSTLRADDLKDERCLAAELYLVNTPDVPDAIELAVKSFVASRRGIQLRVFNITENEVAKKRYVAICNRFKIVEGNSVFYSCGQAVALTSENLKSNTTLAEVFHVELYVRFGCSRCENAKPWIQRCLARYPALSVEICDVVHQADGAERVARLARRYRQSVVSYPVLHLFGELLVGWESAATSGARIEQLLKVWTRKCAAQPNEGAEKSVRTASEISFMYILDSPFFRVSTLAHSGSFKGSFIAAVFCAPLVLYSPLENIPDESTADTTADEENDLLPIDDDAAKSSNEGVIDLPFFHRVDVAELGLPLFTLCVGLVDGFNPCAMWVLVFLLSVLVNLKSRSKLLAVAGTFVFISGLAYFAFMAAWLNLLAWVGFLRPVQIALALLAIGVGIVHVKDFFALHRGLSLSIPESAKPGIYRRVREIVQARSLMLAIGGAIVLAVLVNFIELLCTAGLPCLYSQILTMQNLPWWKDYLYLGLYILAYMFDDTLMILTVVATLSHSKMQETQGRWLKLASGLVILLLGLVMLFRPDWLV